MIDVRRNKVLDNCLVIEDARGNTIGVSTHEARVIMRMLRGLLGDEPADNLPTTYQSGRDWAELPLIGKERVLLLRSERGLTIVKVDLDDTFHVGHDLATTGDLLRILQQEADE